MTAPRKGWVINLHDDSSSREIESSAEPVLVLDGEPVFEVWHYDRVLSRWFVMSAEPNAQLASAGVVYYHPREVPHVLRARVQLLEKMQGVRR